MKQLTVSEVARELGVPDQRIRCGLRANIYPFGKAYKNDGSSHYTYEIWDIHFKKWLKGEL
jgi:hypothetical protein